MTQSGAALTLVTEEQGIIVPRLKDVLDDFAHELEIARTLVDVNIAAGLLVEALLRMSPGI